LYVTDEILFEYDEILGSKYSEPVSANFLIALKELPNVFFTHVYFRWNLIYDQDDNKFVDCYVAAGAQYLISNDADFFVLKTISFPKVNVVKLEDFKDILNNER